MFPFLIKIVNQTLQQVREWMERERHYHNRGLNYYSDITSKMDISSRVALLMKIEFRFERSRDNNMLLSHQNHDLTMLTRFNRFL